MATATVSAPTSQRPHISHNNDAERTVIGALLIDPDAIYKVSGRLLPKDFYDPVFKAIYVAIEHLTQQGTAVDVITVADNLRDHKHIHQIGGIAFLAQLTADVPTASHVETYANIVIEKSRRRHLAELGAHITALPEDTTKTADELTELAEQSFLQHTARTTAQPTTQIGSVLHEWYDTYEALRNNKDAPEHAPVRTGYPDLDFLLPGFEPGQLTIIAGRPSMGKTALALNIAEHVVTKQQKPVVFFSLEMTQRQVLNRLIASELGSETWKLEQGTLTADQHAAIPKVLERLSALPLHIDDDPDRSLTNLRSKARRHQMQHGLALLVIDYLQLIEVTDRAANENQTQRITYISKSLKNLARELQCPIITLSQLSRESERRNPPIPILSDLRDSGSIEQDADRVLMLYRESEYNEDCADPNVTDLYIRKNRQGPTGHIQLLFDKPTTTFHSLSKRKE